MKRAVFIVAASAVLLTGCGAGVEPFQNENDTYSADLAVNSNEYTFILGKETTNVCSQIVTQQSLIMQLSTGTDTKRYISSCESSIKQINECRQVVQTTRPSVGYENDRETALESIDNVLSILELYKADLLSGKLDGISKYSKQLNVEYSILTSLQSVYNN